MQACITDAKSREGVHYACAMCYLKITNLRLLIGFASYACSRRGPAAKAMLVAPRMRTPSLIGALIEHPASASKGRPCAAPHTLAAIPACVTNSICTHLCRATYPRKALGLCHMGCRHCAAPTVIHTQRKQTRIGRHHGAMASKFTPPTCCGGRHCPQAPRKKAKAATISTLLCAHWAHLSYGALPPCWPAYTP